MRRRCVVSTRRASGEIRSLWRGRRRQRGFLLGGAGTTRRRCVWRWSGACVGRSQLAVHENCVLRVHLRIATPAAPRQATRHPHGGVASFGWLHAMGLQASSPLLSLKPAKQGCPKYTTCSSCVPRWRAPAPISLQACRPMSQNQEGRTTYVTYYDFDGPLVVVERRREQGRKGRYHILFYV